MTTTKITAHTYVCELPDMIQNQILAECKATFESLAFPVDIEEQLENVKGYLDVYRLHFERVLKYIPSGTLERKQT